MALNGRNLASLSDDEQVVYDYFKAHGRQCGVRLAQVVKPVFLSFELSADHGMTDEQISVLTDRTSTIISVDIEKVAEARKADIRVIDMTITDTKVNRNERAS